MQSISFFRVCPRLVVCILFFMFLAGCAGKHQMVPENERVLLSVGSERSEAYTKGPLTVEYKYNYTDSTFTVSGSVEYSQRVDSLDVRIVFLDSSGYVLAKKIVYSSGYRTFASREGTRTFRTRLEVPAGTAGFIFTSASKDRASRP